MPLIILIYLVLFACSSSATDPLIVPVKLFAPKAMRISTDDLPPPYHTSSAQKPSIVIPIPENGTLLVPNLGFRVSVYRDRLKYPRQMVYTPTNDILVTERHGNQISILSGDDTSIFADQSNGISGAFGMAFVKKWFYVANAGDLRRYPYKTGDKRLQGNGEVLLIYQSAEYRTRNLLIPPNSDRLYLTISSNNDTDIEYPPQASVQVMKLDGSNRETFAWGLCNPVGIDVHPRTGDIYVAVQERDTLGDDLVPDYFTRIQKDDFYGWPFAYLSPKNVDPRRRFSNGSSERADLVERTSTPDVLFQAHSAVLGMQFYRGQQFPKYYQNGAFAAFHGSWNRHSGVGFNIVFIPFDDDNRPKGYYEEFLKGFMTDSKGPKTWGRPVGVLVMKDGSLLVSEDGNGRLYRIEYVGRKSKLMPLVSSTRTISMDSVLFLFLILWQILFRH